MCVCTQSLSRVRLCEPLGYSLPGSSVHGIIQTRLLERLPFPLVDISHPGTKPMSPESPALQEDSLLLEPLGKSHEYVHLFQILFLYRLLQNIEYSFWCYTVGPCWLFILYIIVSIYSSQTPNLSLPPFPF